MLLLSEPDQSVVRERWDRSSQLGVRRDSDGYPVGVDDGELVDRRSRLDDVLREQQELLARLAAPLASGPRVVLVADREGVIVRARAERGALDPATRVRLVEGAHWGEGVRGTNAIGTALAERRPVAVVGDAHFELRNRELYCYAAPIRDAFGEVVAVLDVSGPLHSHDPAIGLAVLSASLELEHALRRSAYADARSGALALIERMMLRSSSPELLVDRSGTVRAANSSARAALGVSVNAQLRCDRVFGVGYDELMRNAASGQARFETAAGRYRLTLDPVLGEGEQALAVLVHFEREPERIVSPLPPRAEPAVDPAFDAILGEDAALVRARELASRFAKTKLPVLLLAETGTGKELFARAIHRASDRAGKAFVAVNCGALEPSLLNSELFGYAPGAFTGAARSGSDGRVAAADGGTLFLDEIAETSEAFQAALLRVLDDGTYQRVGEHKERRADFRLICATCRDLRALVAAGKFRSDLYYRIFGACLTIPALRDRSDVVWLSQTLLARENPGLSLASATARRIADHPWPGNVRELKSAMAYAAAMAAPSREVLPDHLPAASLSVAPARGAPQTRDAILREAVEAALREADGNVSEAARRLGVGRGTIYRATKKPLR